MSKNEFVHLHLHSEYSLLDGACRIAKIPKRVKELGMNSVAITDHGNMFASVSAAMAFKDSEVKPIIGCEIYVTRPGLSRTVREKDNYGRHYYHLVLLAESYEGYINLCKLSSIGYVEGYYYKPRVDMETLAKHSGGLIALSACLAGCVPKALVNGDYALACEWADMHRQIFGKDRYFLEIENHGIPDEKIAIRELTRLSADMGIPLVATNDAHYIKAEDYNFHDIMLCIQTGKTKADEHRFRFQGDQFYIKSPDEMATLFSEHPDSLRQTLAIAERCNGRVKFDKDYKNEGITLLPVFRPEDGSTDIEYLRKLTYDGLRERYGQLNQNIIDRTEFELGTIEKMGFASYFLVVWDFINYAKVNGIPVGPGRGSAAGAIVAYALKITDIDPLAHSLFFERFLNPERISMPDIDIDFCFENRWRVIEYVKKKYGVESVGQIITFGTLQPKNAIADVGRAMGVALERVNEIKKMIPPDAKMDKVRGISGIEVALEQVPELQRAAQDPEIAEMLQYASAVEGMPRHCSTHAAGVVIADINLTDVVPIYQPYNSKDIAVQYTMSQVEKVGLLKMDFLGLKNLTIIENAQKSIRQHLGIEIDWAEIGLEDPDTYKLLQEGRTFGVFQLESPGMTKLVKDLAPTTFSDITALLALYRPGPLGSNMDRDFVECKHGRQDVVYDHPSLEPILKETYGMILYQEQVMQIAQVLAGYSLGQADNLRRAMGKKKLEEMAAARTTFISGSEANGVNAELAGYIFDKIEKFAAYGFNKSHSAAYALLSYRTAYLKAHYPVHYMAALMTNAIGGKVEEMAEHFAEAKANHVRILPPDVNYSDKNFAVHGDDVRFGLAAIKNVGTGAVEGILEARSKGGLFKSFEDFCKRVDLTALNSRMFEALIKVGAFDSITSNRAQLFAAFGRILNAVSDRMAEEAMGQGSLFGDGEQTDADILKSHKVADWPEAERLEFEKEYLGYYVSGNPFETLRLIFDSLSECPFLEFTNLKNEQEVQFAGKLATIRCVPSKKDPGMQMGFGDLEDLDGTKINLVFFTRIYEANRNLLKVGTNLLVKGKYQSREYNGRDEKSILVDSVELIHETQNPVKMSLCVEVDRNHAVKPEFHERFTSVLRKHPGPTKILLHHNTGDGMLIADFGYRLAVDVNNPILHDLNKLNGVVKTTLIKEEISENR